VAGTLGLPSLGGRGAPRFAEAPEHEALYSGPRNRLLRARLFYFVLADAGVAGVGNGIILAW
jgi:hypothetical protein